MTVHPGVWRLLVMVLASSACGGSERVGAGDAGAADAADAPGDGAADPLAAFSASSA